MTNPKRSLTSNDVRVSKLLLAVCALLLVICSVGGTYIYMHKPTVLVVPASGVGSSDVKELTKQAISDAETAAATAAQAADSAHKAAESTKKTANSAEGASKDATQAAHDAAKNVFDQTENQRKTP